MTGKYAFTLSEVLITLGVIGVVAAVTIPVIVNNYQKHITVNKLKKVYSTLSQIMTKSYMDNGYASEFLQSGETVTTDKTEEFFNTYWLPYFNAPTVANPYFYNEKQPYYQLNGNNITQTIGTLFSAGRILFKTPDGTIYYMKLMDWQNTTDENGEIINHEAVYASNQIISADINGTRGPNTYGKDIFIFNIDLTSNTIVPIYNTDSQIKSDCTKKARGMSCAAKIMRDGWKISNDYPW